jgi:ParB-like chromosome segregation protein Spo0J
MSRLVGIEMVPIASVHVPTRDYPTTFKPGGLPDSQSFSDLVESVRHDGVLNPILVTRTNKILVGHYRLWAAVKAGLKTVPILVDEEDKWKSKG